MRPLAVDVRIPTTDRFKQTGQQSAFCDGWSITRPGLEYQYACDLCAVQVHRTGGPVAPFASGPFYARALLKRLEGSQIVFCPVGKWGDESRDDWGALSPEVTWERIELIEPASKVVPLSVSDAIWAEPERGDGRATLETIRQKLHPTGRLWVITSGGLSRFLPEWRRAEDRPARDPAGRRQTLRWLRQSGFRVQSQYGFHGPVSIFWGYASRLMECLGRGDLADRCLFRMRAGYSVSGGQTLWVPVGVSLAML